MDKLEKKEERIQNYINANILLDAVDNIESNATEEILVASTSNINYADMQNLNQLPEADLIAYKTQLVEAINTYEIKKDEIVKTNNGNTYIHIISQIQNEDNKLDMSVYYTIMSGRLLTISFRYFNKAEQLENEQEKDAIQKIEFYDVERPKYTMLSETYKLTMAFMVVILIILAIIVFFIRRKDKKLFNNSIQDRQIKQYSKFGGLILFFWSLCFYQVLLRVIDIDNASKIENMEFYTTAVTIQSTILALIAMYQIYITVKRKQNTPKKIIISNIIFGVSGVIITIARIIYAKIVPLEIYTQEYFEQENSVLIFNIIYPLIWILYFIFSKRVQVYYYLPERRKKKVAKDTKSV